MKRVHKFPLETPTAGVDMPIGATIVSGVAMPTGGIAIYAMVDEDRGAVHRRVQAFNTGDPIPEGARFIATVSTGTIVWHLFDQGDGPR